MSLIVSKFGGTSLAHAQAIQRSVLIAQAQQDLGVIVVSAMAGTTDRLLHLSRAAAQRQGDLSRQILQEIKLQHQQAARELDITGPDYDWLEEYLLQIQNQTQKIAELQECSARERDHLLSFGELLSSRLMYHAAKNTIERPIVWLDVRKVLKTNNQFGKALPLLEQISQLCTLHLSPLVAQQKIVVTQGFIGATRQGVTTTLGRGGSDYSAALLAEGASATQLQIWTDVPGVATTDPRICPSAHFLNELSFVEAAELATFGAKVLHPTTMWPAMRKNIPIFVGSSLDSTQRGTWIRQKTAQEPTIRAIALREQQSILTLSTPRMVSTHGFLYDIFQIFKKHEVSVDLVSTSEISVAITVDESILKNDSLIQDLSELGQIKVESGYGLISLIGNRIGYTAELGKKILEAIAPTNVRLLCSGASEHNFCFLIDNKTTHPVIKKLHQKFLHQPSVIN